MSVGAQDKQMVRSRRILQLYLPTLSTDRARLSARAPIDGPFATIDKANGAYVLDAVDALAAASGLAPGLSLAEARAQVPDLRVEHADPSADAACLLALARACDRYTPLVGLDRPQGLFLDVSGCAHLFDGEAGLIADLAARLHRFGLTARLAIAERPAIASAVARYGVGGIVPAGDALRAVKPLPAAALRLPDETVAVLARLGLKTVAHVLDQPRAPMVRRFGAQLADRIDQLTGLQDEPITPLAPVAPYSVERRFTEPVANLDAIAACVDALADALCRQLERRANGVLALGVRLFHADGMVRDVGAGASRPTADPRRIKTLLAPQLEALVERAETHSGVDCIRLFATQTAKVAEVQTDFDTEHLVTALSELIDTLSGRLGSRSVRRIAPVDSHQPAKAQARKPAQITPEVAWSRREPVPPPGHPLRRPLRLFEPPEPVEALAGVPDGPPVRFRWRRVSYQVAAAEGPERIAPDWWVGGGQTCDYFRVEDINGRRFWLFREGLYDQSAEPPRWYMHGLFA